LGLILIFAWAHPFKLLNNKEAARSHISIFTSVGCRVVYCFHRIRPSFILLEHLSHAPRHFFLSFLHASDGNEEVGAGLMVG